MINLTFTDSVLHCCKVTEYFRLSTVFMYLYCILYLLSISHILLYIYIYILFVHCGSQVNVILNIINDPDTAESCVLSRAMNHGSSGVTSLRCLYLSVASFLVPVSFRTERTFFFGSELC